MVNPFAEVVEDDVDDAHLVEQAKKGSRAALEKLVLRHQAWIYNIAVRMVFQPQDAEEVTQEVLVKVITKLSTFKGESKFRTWLYRIAANHVLNMKRRSPQRTRVTTFADYGAAIDSTPDLDLPDPKSVPVAVPPLGRRSQERLHDGYAALSGPQATADLHARRDPRRQRYCRRRGPGDDCRQLSSMSGPGPPRPPQLHEQPVRTGEHQAIPVAARKRLAASSRQGHVDPHHLLFVPQHVQRVRDVAAETVREIEDVVERQHAAIYRDHPFLQPSDEISLAPTDL